MNTYDEKLKKKLVLIAVVPAFNEARFISNVIHSAKKYVDQVISSTMEAPMTLKR